MQGVVAFGAHVIRAAKIVLRDRRIPRPVKGLLVLGALPIPGPFDEAVLLFAGGLLYTFYREPMLEAWHRARLTERDINRSEPTA